MVGTDKTVQAAIQKNGLEKLKRIVKSLTSCSHIHTLLFHWFGNYTLQDLVAASSKLRTAAVAALHKAQVLKHLAGHQVMCFYVFSALLRKCTKCGQHLGFVCLYGTKVLFTGVVQRRCLASLSDY